MSLYPRLEVCRDFLDNKCKRSEDSCRFAHPPSNIQIVNGAVICCTDSLQDRCKREDPPCRYFHPPTHLKVQVRRDMRERKDRSRNRSPLYGRQRERSPSPGYYDNYRGDNNYYNDYDERRPANVNDNILENIVINNMLPQLALLKEQLLNGLSGNLNMSNLEATLASLRNTSNLTECLASGNLNMDTDFRRNDYDAGYRDDYRDRSWDRSSPPRNSRKDPTFEVCRDFLNASCNRKDCRYAHPSSDVHIDRNNRVTVCLNNLRDKCRFDDCKYYHLPSHLKGAYYKGETCGPSRKRRRFSNNAPKKQKSDETEENND